MFKRYEKVDIREETDHNRGVGETHKMSNLMREHVTQNRDDYTDDDFLFLYATKTESPYNHT